MPSGYEKSPDYGGKPPSRWEHFWIAIATIVFSVVVGWFFIGGLAAKAQTSDALRLATWNLENLDATNGEGNTPRIDGDYALLMLHAMEMNADVVAL